MGQGSQRGCHQERCSTTAEEKDVHRPSETTLMAKARLQISQHSLETLADPSNNSPSDSPEILQSNEVPDPVMATTAIPEHIETTRQPQVSYYALSSTSPSSDLSAILSLSNAIFHATPDSTKYSSPATWQSHLSTPNSIIFCAAVPLPDTEAKVQPIGFVFAFAKTPADYPEPVKKQLTELEQHEVMHVWLAGVVQEYRSRGVFGDLMHLVENYAAVREITRMSVATMPARFERMFDVLRKEGWTVLGDRDLKSEGEGEEKVVLINDVDATSWKEIGVAK